MLLQRLLLSLCGFVVLSVQALPAPQEPTVTDNAGPPVHTGGLNQVQTGQPNIPSEKLVNNPLSPARVGPNRGANKDQIREAAKKAASGIGIAIPPGQGFGGSTNRPHNRRQSVPLAYIDQACGPDVNHRAAPGLCCSQWGWAGVTSEHCGQGCQSAWGRCDDGKLPKVYTQCAKSGVIALTFDDGPSVLTSGLLDYLNSKNVKVTFFLNGLNWKNIDTKNPLPGIFALKDVVKKAFDTGHQICSHTFSHIDLLSSISDQYNITYEMTKMNHAFRETLGTIPTCMRPPYGDYDETSLKILRGLGYSTDTTLKTTGAIVSWNLDPVDWNPFVHGATIAAQVADMQKEFQTQTAGSTAATSRFITLNHDVWNTTADFRPKGQGQLASQVPPVKPLAQQAIEYFLSKNYKFARVDECLGFAKNSMYRQPTPNDEVCGPWNSDGSACYS
ncbi:uncharacterized protein SPPG_03958 [Spizellomyces punctatus DAOM BR117]|uniref:NodB homology domain-containing protein n=1 Tax=Spizellomyces punctatus (strain DAOM BR117) TaxID=645134 RepID=A0A0L0HJ45_SPIPD|nr:uncharacterized protein SPPG_03958 [Spizellomyces punctatus DAOM BR117]KND00854.1 hypothetical protein SPPG_03958 [Spizellomyces punctatus DAOM BR117]|eukprot:XP_016608893.1 hypothetical protein SPPG_03958 [Spizellomyces punctatus DAOM BR117]